MSPADQLAALASLQPGTTYRIEVEAVRKGDGSDDMGNFTTEREGYETISVSYSLSTCIDSVDG